MNLENPSLRTCMIQFSLTIYFEEGIHDHVRQCSFVEMEVLMLVSTRLVRNPPLHRFYLVWSEAVFQVIIEIRESHFSWSYIRCGWYDAVCKGSA